MFFKEVKRMQNVMITNIRPRVIERRQKEFILLGEGTFTRKNVIKNYVYSPEFKLIG